MHALNSACHLFSPLKEIKGSTKKGWSTYVSTYISWLPLNLKKKKKKRRGGCGRPVCVFFHFIISIWFYDRDVIRGTDIHEAVIRGRPGIKRWLSLTLTSLTMQVKIVLKPAGSKQSRCSQTLKLWIKQLYRVLLKTATPLNLRHILQYDKHTWFFLKFRLYHCFFFFFP
jgi:hypothetical protein